MLREEDIAIDLKCQQYICKSYMRNLEGTESVLLFESRQKTEDVFCPFCHGPVRVYPQNCVNEQAGAKESEERRRAVHLIAALCAW